MGAQIDQQGNYYFPADMYIQTESTKQIGRWNCYQVITNPKYRSPEAPYNIFWYSTDVDFPVQLFGDQLRQLFGNSEEVDGLFKRLAQFDGYPVRTEAHGVRYSTITTLIKLERVGDIDPMLFEVPEGYDKNEIPERIPGMQWGQ
ncbi:MAG: hypothetical protein ABH878_03760 [bacterium]